MSFALIAYSPSRFAFPLPPKHRFPVEKYSRLRERLQIAGWEIRDAAPVAWDAVLAVHDERYVDQLRKDQLDPKAIRELGFPWSQELLVRSLASVGGTVQAADQALETGFAANLAGGTHHAFSDRGEGFCVLNDVVIAARHLQLRGELSNAAIVDLDVHQGNGTAVMASSWRWLHTISVHGSRNYPFRKQTSDLDVGLPDQVSGREYQSELSRHVFPYLERIAPDFVFLNAGADVLKGDRYGRLNLSIPEIAERDRSIAAFCHHRSIPFVWVMGGGYHPDINQTVSAHLASLETIRQLYR